MKRKKKNDGHTKFPNDVLEGLMQAALGGRDFRAVLVVARRTYGWHKPEDSISLTTIGKLAGLSHKSHISSVVKSLTDRCILRVTGKGNRGCKKYRINNHIQEWKIEPRVTENGNRRAGLPEKVTEGLPQTVTVGLQEKVTVLISDKESIKETIQKKETSYVSLEGLSDETWEAYLELRTKKKKPVTNHAITLIMRKLKRWQAEGMNPEDVLNRSIENGWTGIYELPQNGNGKKGERLVDKYPVL